MNFQLELPKEACQFIIDVLVERPFREVAPLVNEIKRQLDAQVPRENGAPSGPDLDLEKLRSAAAEALLKEQEEAAESPAEPEEPAE